MKQLEETLKNAELRIPLAQYRKIMAYTTLSDIEISGLAEVTYSPERNVFVVGEVYLLEQENTATTTHLPEEGHAAFNLAYIKKTRGKKDRAFPRLWWHSHVNMKAFLSPTDEATLTDRKTDGFTIALVVNKQREMAAKAYVCIEGIYTALGQEVALKEWITLDALPVRVELEYERIPDALKQEVSEKVKEPPKPVFKKPWNGKKWQVPSWPSKVKVFPSNKEQVLGLISRFNLMYEWSEEDNEFLWVSPLQTTRYRDLHGITETLTDKEWQSIWDQQTDGGGK